MLATKASLIHRCVTFGAVEDAVSNAVIGLDAAVVRRLDFDLAHGAVRQELFDTGRAVERVGAQKVLGHQPAGRHGLATARHAILCFTHMHAARKAFDMKRGLFFAISNVNDCASNFCSACDAIDKEAVLEARRVVGHRVILVHRKGFFSNLQTTVNANKAFAVKHCAVR